MGIIEIALCIWKNKRTSVRPQRYPIGDIYVNEIGTFEQKDMSLQDLRSKLEMVVEK